MNIALCYENVDPTRGGCETYIADLTRRLVSDGHAVHLYASRWNASALPTSVTIHALPSPSGPRFLRPWRFAKSCLAALQTRRHEVTIGFDKTWGLDVHYPQGGIHAASQQANSHKHSSPLTRGLAGLVKAIDPAARSFAMLERRQFRHRPTLIVNSAMVRGHAVAHYGVDANDVHIVHAAIDPARFAAVNRETIRVAGRAKWGVAPGESVALFVAMNYRLKGLVPLLHSLRHVPRGKPFRLVVVGHPRFERFRRLAERLGVADRVVFHGFCDDARNVYFAGDFLVHPTFYDPCSLVALEALACGLPVVTTRFNGAGELLDPPHDGLIVDDPHRHEQLAAAIAHFLDRDVLRAASERAFAAASRWTFDDHYRKMMAILEGVAARTRAAGSIPRAA